MRFTCGPIGRGAVLAIGILGAFVALSGRAQAATAPVARNHRSRLPVSVVKNAAIPLPLADANANANAKDDQAAPAAGPVLGADHHTLKLNGGQGIVPVLAPIAPLAPATAPWPVDGLMAPPRDGHGRDQIASVGNRRPATSSAAVPMDPDVTAPGTASVPRALAEGLDPAATPNMGDDRAPPIPAIGTPRRTTTAIATVSARRARGLRHGRPQHPGPRPATPAPAGPQPASTAFFVAPFGPDATPHLRPAVVPSSSGRRTRADMPLPLDDLPTASLAVLRAAPSRGPPAADQRGRTTTSHD